MSEAQPDKSGRGEQAQSVRLLPALMITLGVVLGLKAVAVAAEAGDAAAPAAQNAAPAAAPAAAPGADAALAAGQSCPAGPTFADQAGLSQTEVRVLQSLGERRKTLDGRAAEIDAKADLLAAAEKRVDERVAELKKLETSVQALLGQLDQQQSERIVSLVAVYQKMRAKDAAAVFDGLDDDVMLEVASRMKQTNLAEIMGAMRPERARQLTRLLADQKKVPDLLPSGRPGAAPAGR
jgi:flagellar motility protein MotE (MotC chaperone)